MKIWCNTCRYNGSRNKKFKNISFDWDIRNSISTIFPKKKFSVINIFFKKKNSRLSIFSVINILGYQHSRLLTFSVINILGYQYSRLSTFSVISSRLLISRLLFSRLLMVTNLQRAVSFWPALRALKFSI